MYGTWVCTGELHPHFFKASYNFVNDIKSGEMQEVKAMLNKVKNPEKKEKLKELLGKMVRAPQLLYWMQCGRWRVQLIMYLTNLLLIFL
jgi:hypothetical protein